MQRVTQKKLDLTLVQPVLELAERLGIETTASFITGYPEETVQDQDETLDMIGRCFTPSCLVQLHMLVPEPGTPLSASHGRTIRYDGYGSRYNAGVLGPHDQRLILDHPDIFQTYYYYPTVLPRERNIFAVEAVDMARRIGPTLLRYLLQAFDGRLSRFVEEWRSFAGRDGRPSQSALEACIEAKLGPRHHLLSLIRYAFSAQEPVDGPTTLVEAALGETGTKYALNSRLRILTGMHDCALLMERIGAMAGHGGFLDESEAGELGTYLVNTEQVPWKVYRVAAGVEEILGLFGNPRDCAEVSDLVRVAAAGQEIDPTFFSDLILARIIVPSATAQPSVF
jgi:hypothetical protein